MSTDVTRWKVQVLNDSRHCILPGRSWCDYRSCHILISRLSKISASGLYLRTSASSLSHTRINSCNKMRGTGAIWQQTLHFTNRGVGVIIDPVLSWSPDFQEYRGLDVKTSVGPLISTWMKSCNKMKKGAIRQKALNFTWKNFVWWYIKFFQDDYIIFVSDLTSEAGEESNLTAHTIPCSTGQPLVSSQRMLWDGQEYLWYG